MALGKTNQRDLERAAAWQAWIRQRHPFAIASLVLGIFSLIEFGALLIFGIAGIILGVLAIKKIRAGAALGIRLAAAVIFLSAASLVVAALLYMRVWG